MTVAVLGGLDRLKPTYELKAKNMGIDIRLFFRRVPNLAKRLNGVQGIVIFTGTVSHAIVEEASRLARRRGIPLERSRTSSITGLKKCLGKLAL
ncbi:MAG: DUF2325 domain-containing protein [Nitrospinaceae bacterium]